MGRNDIELFYLNTIISCEMSPEEREEELKWLKEESDKLTEWLPT